MIFALSRLVVFGLSNMTETGKQTHEVTYNSSGRIYRLTALL